VYLIVDYDSAEDRRFRFSHFPDIRRQSGALTLSGHVSKNDLHKVMFAIPKPAIQVLRKDLDILKNSVVQDLRELSKLGSNELVPGQIYQTLSDIEKEVWESYRRASSLSEFNAIFMSRLINAHWNLPTVFLTASAALPLMRNHYEFLLHQYPALVDISNQVTDELQSEGVMIPDTLRLRTDIFPLWYVCPKCSERVMLSLRNGDSINAEGICQRCRSNYYLALGTYSAPNLECLPNMAPRVLFDDWMDMIGYGISGGSTYIGGAEHVVLAGLIASRLGWPVPPEVLWRPYGIYFGPAETRIAKILKLTSRQELSSNVRSALELIILGKACILYYLLSQGICGLKEMWDGYFASGGQVNGVNIGSPHFAIEEDAKSILEDEMRTFV